MPYPYIRRMKTLPHRNARRGRVERKNGAFFTITKEKMERSSKATIEKRVLTRND